LLCLSNREHGLQLITSKGYKWLVLACGCKRPNVQAQMTFTGSDAARAMRGKKSATDVEELDDTDL